MTSTTRTYPFPPQVRYDLDAIVARLRATAETWVPRLFPNGRRVGDEWRLANIKGAAPRKQGSCVIALKGEHAGDWHDFDGGQGGGPLSTIEEATGLKGRDLFAYAAEMAGWSPGASDPSGAATDGGGKAGTRRRARDRLHSRALRARSPARRRQPICVGRGLAVPDGADLLAHADLTHWETKSGYPALIGVVRDRAGEHHRHSPDVPAVRCRPSRTRWTKAAVSKPRMMLGKNGGGAVRLAPLGDSGVLALCEGIETGLAVMTACPGLPVWATLSTTGLEQVQLPREAAAHRHPRRPRCLRRWHPCRRDCRAAAAG